MNNSVISGQGVGFLIPITVLPLTQAQGSKQHGVHLPQNRIFSKKPQFSSFSLGLSLSLSLSFSLLKGLWLTVPKHLRVINLGLIEAEQKAVTVLVHFTLNFEFLL